MRPFINTALLIIVISSISGCMAVTTVNSKPGNSGNAPGQIKKTTGSQSAKPYAPGQQKKKN